MSGTLAVAVRKGLIDDLAALPALTTVSSSTGQAPTVEFAYRLYPPTSEPRERVWTQRARFTHEPASLKSTTTFRNEVCLFEIVVLVKGLALSPYDTSARAVEIGHVIEDHIATHASWPDVAGLNSLTIQGDGQLLEAFNENGSLAELTLPVRYTARLTT